MGGAYSEYDVEERRKLGFGGKPEEKMQLGRPWRRWEDIIKLSGMMECGLGQAGLG
jgi:hypothetical protein